MQGTSGSSLSSGIAVAEGHAVEEVADVVVPSAIEVSGADAKGGGAEELAAEGHVVARGEAGASAEAVGADARARRARCRRARPARASTEREGRATSTSPGADCSSGTVAAATAFRGSAWK